MTDIVGSWDAYASKNICRILAEHMNMKHGTHREKDPEDANDDHQDMIAKGF